ncbi:hypothetical protein WCD74_10865 [Actinomycetospora sp. OC33-EN08]|uniref:Peptidase S9 prolyl oligopeptidase catalytic domain-containing protein n=1 Tax=Actinomycetospora aurantiaca TaxID=3129233 RepID=A0ABU8MLS1_9PSEU
MFGHATTRRPFFSDNGFQFAVEVTLGGVRHGAADPGDVLSTIARIPDGRPEAWVAEWTATADRVADEARSAEAAGHRASAAARWLRAANYYARATDSADTAEVFTGLWEHHRDAWDRFCDLTTAIGDLAIERIAVPYGGSTLPGYVFTRPGAGPRRTLVFVNGSDGSVVSAWTDGAADALARGWTVVTVDGPGQNAALVRQGIPFRPDWEAVLTPLIDHVITRDDVDGDRIAVLGLSQGGFWVPRAVAHEHRVAAAVADPGVVDVSTAGLANLPGFLRRTLDAGEKHMFDQEMAWGLRFSRGGLATTLAWRMRPYGVDSPYDFFTAAQQYRLTPDDLAGIRCPMLITDPEHEQFWPGQSAELARSLTCPVTVVPFTAAEGADRHCEPLAPALRGERILDWLDDTVPADPR